MTESGRACAVHGLTECPGYKMIEGSAREKLYKRHQELRKKSGLPDPEYYQELKASYDLPDEERLARVKEIKKKYNVNEAGPFSYGAKKPRKGSVADLAAQKRKEQERGKQPIEPKDQRVGTAKIVKELDVRGASAGDQAAYDQYAQVRAKGDILDREASATPSPVSFAGSTQSGFNQDLKPKTQVAQSQLSKDLIAAQTTGLAAQNPEMEKRYTMNKLAVKPTKTNAEIAAQLESQGVAEGKDDLSQYSTERLKAYVEKVSGGGVPAFGSGAKLKRVQAELKRREQGVAEGRKPDYNFDIEDIKKLEQVRDLETLKTLALQLISKPSAKPMKPEKVEWFKSALDRMDSPLKVIKLMYDLLLSGEGHSVIGSRKSMNPNTYRQRFGEDQVTNEDVEKYLEEMQRAGYEVLHEESHSCPECGGPAFSDQVLAEKKDACYSKVKSRYKVWPSAYASGALVRCRKVGAKNWGNKSKK